MGSTLERLQELQESLYQQLYQIGDFRRGIISVNYRKCGKKNCACAKEGHPGHGPQFLWNTTIKGKSYAKNLSLGPDLQKYRQETDNYRKFTELCDELVAVKEKICDLQPTPEIHDTNELEELKKNLKRHFMRKYKKRLSGL